MEMPEMNKLMGIFPLKYGCFLIALFGLGLGGVLLAGIILYGIAENMILAQFGQEGVDEGVKKAVLMPIGISSLLLLLANSLLLMGVMLKRESYVSTSVLVLLFMCIILLAMSMAAPLSCFFLAATCLVQRASLLGMICGFLIITLFLEVWLYCAAVAWNLGQNM